MRRIFLAIAMSFFLVHSAHAAETSDRYKGYELPPYSVLSTDEGVEVRLYQPRIVAEVEITGDRSEAANKGFRMLADYIFGKNVSTQAIPMTSPVTQRDGSEQIAMTSPVTQSETGQGRWIVQFGMPQPYTLETLPKPENPAIRLREEKGYKATAYRFSGLWTDRRFKEARAQLMAYLAVKGLTPVGSPIFAYYDDPFTLPWSRRNEVIWEIE